MQKNSDQQHHAQNTILKKLVQAGNQASFIEAVMRSRQDANLVDELAQCFLNIQVSCRSGQNQSRVPALKLIRAIEEIAANTGIPANRFYPALLEKILLEEPEATPTVAAKPSTKERILEAALEVFSLKGFHTATTDEIAERAGVGKGTLYRYFETKEKLFGELVRTRLEELEKKAGSIISGHDDVLTMISKYIRIYFEFFDRNQHLYRLVIQEQLDLGEHAPELYFKRVMRALPNLKRKVYEGSQQGILKDIDFQTVFFGTMGFVHGVIQKWLARDCSYSLVEELPSVLEVLFYGFVKDAAKVECED